jgi:glycine/D-amino acid oxidase-like deaminating enzyme
VVPTITTDHRTATVQRDLRTGTPVWLRHGDVQVPSSPLSTSLTVDVAVVGAGVSGALVADALLRSGKSVAVLDRRGPVKGSTPASTALLQFELDQPLIHLTQKIGRKRAVRAYWRSATAVDTLRGRIADLGLRCSFRERITVYLPGNVLNVAALKREAAAPAEVGLRSRFIVEVPDESWRLRGAFDTRSEVGDGGDLARGLVPPDGRVGGRALREG